ncbi:unnamed protein product [Phytophthora fragariaefolia]|uniref:Unnamed protein product n=1 Tax=Phytophthora fragariaefolia TaxID=1490495 RepID=A0A9W6XR56_9STRA|nr:unnamed protein product [Phytophthora fragariaefolia]
MEDGEEEEETSSSKRDERGVGSRRSREDDSGASGSKRSRDGSDRPLAGAGPLSSPRSGDNSTPSDVGASRTGPVREPWMPTPSEIESRFRSTSPPSQYAVYSCGGLKADDVTMVLDFDPATDQRRDYYIGLFHELRWYGNTKTSCRSRVPECQALCQSWGAFVQNFNSNPAGCRGRVCLARERFERFSQHPTIERLHWGAVEAALGRVLRSPAASVQSSLCAEPSAPRHTSATPREVAPTEPLGRTTSEERSREPIDQAQHVVAVSSQSLQQQRWSKLGARSLRAEHRAPACPLGAPAAATRDEETSRELGVVEADAEDSPTMSSSSSDSTM